jgi:hypothetical protein
VDVSLERDDQKIRQGYAHSKITLVRVPSEQPAAVLTPTQAPIRRRRKLAVAAVCGLGLTGLLIAGLGQGRLPTLELAAEHRAASAALRPLGHSSSGVDTGHSLLNRNEASLYAAPHVNLVSSEALEATEMGESPDSKAMPQPQRMMSKRQRARALTARLNGGAHESAESPSGRSGAALSDSSSAASTVEAGADLLPNRRNAVAHIDRENPYR